MNLPELCANYRDENGNALVVPDIIVHRRGPDGPNVVVLELKKTTNPEPRECDIHRLHAFRQQLHYSVGTLIECETRSGREPDITISEWFA